MTHEPPTPADPLLHHSEFVTRVAAYAVVTEGGKLLLTWYNGHGGGMPQWSLPGGGVEYHETPEAAVVREVSEETGLDVVVGNLLTTDTFWWPTEERTGRPYKSLRLFYDATVAGGTLGTLEVAGSTEFAEWVELERVRTLEPRADFIDLALDLVRDRAPGGSASATR